MTPRSRAIKRLIEENLPRFEELLTEESGRDGATVPRGQTPLTDEERRGLKEKAIQMRAENYSYNQISERLGIAKFSVWCYINGRYGNKEEGE